MPHHTTRTTARAAPQRRIKTQLRQAVLERDDYTCQYCGKRPKYLQKRSGWNGRTATLHIDHMVPVSKGGSEDIENLVTACCDCNLRKYDNLWSIPVAYCLDCGDFYRQPPGAHIVLGMSAPLFLCANCEGFDFDAWEEAGAFSDLELEQRAWDAIEASAWAAA